jgi:hypothetical protein
LERPVRKLIGKSIPAFGPPAVTRPFLLQDHVLPPEPREVLTHCEPGLAAAYDHSLNPFGHRSPSLDGGREV